MKQRELTDIHRMRVFLRVTVSGASARGVKTAVFLS